MTFKNHEDDYDFDYLDDLMKDVMSDNSNESSESSTDNFDNLEKEKADTINSNHNKDDKEVQTTSLNQPNMNKNKSANISSKRRVPLFKRIGVELNSTQQTDENIDNQEEVADNNINSQLNDDKKNDLIDEKTDDNCNELPQYTSKQNELNDIDYNKKETVEKTSLDKSNQVNNDEPANKDSDDLMDSMLDDMLEDFTSNPTSEDDINSQINTNEDVIVPLETPEMKTAKVTADGRTLAEILPGMRGGPKSAIEIARKIKNQETVVEVNGVKFSDDRYTKHVKVINKEAEEQKKRNELSKKFLQRNAKFTEQEKIIMSNLGVTNKQFTDLMKSTELTLKQKQEILGLGRYGAEKHFKGRKYRTTVGDMAMLEFLVKFKFANTRILRWISNEPQGRTWRKLNRLRDNGLVESQTLIGIPDLWAATYAGVGVAGYTYDPGLRPSPKMITISSSLGVNYIAACLWFNSVNVLNLPDFPAHNREIALQDDGRDKVRGETLVSELEIRSSLGKEINPQSTTMQALGNDRLYDIISSNVRREFDEWEMGGKVGASPEMLLGNEYMWVLYPTSQLTLSYHVPDLVVKRERGPNGEPRSIAVEMERYDKSNDKYDKIMLAYKLDEHLYEKVIWITPNTRVARALERAARGVGFDRYSIIPIITENGTYNKQDIWLI